VCVCVCVCMCVCVCVCLLVIFLIYKFVVLNNPLPKIVRNLVDI